MGQHYYIIATFIHLFPGSRPPASTFESFFRNAIHATAELHTVAVEVAVLTLCNGNTNVTNTKMCLQSYGSGRRDCAK